MADGNPLGPQPDFNLIGDELRKASNLPAITNGQQILAELQAIRQDMVAHRQDTTTELQAIRQDIADSRRDLITMMTASYVQPLNILILLC